MPNTSNGKLFEEEVYEKLVVPSDWINLTPYELRDTPSKSGQKYIHKVFSNQFKKQFDFSTKDVWSKNIDPDFVFYNPVLKKVIALEAKCQSSSGSVDEKLQTGGKKLKRLRQLFERALQIPAENVSYTYLLKQSDFDKPEYRDTFDDIHEDGCEYYFVNDGFAFDLKNMG